jgi:hypothetical protein
MPQAVFEDPDRLADAGDAAVAHHGNTTDLLLASEAKQRIAAQIADATAAPRDDAATEALDRGKVASLLPDGRVLLDATVHGAGHDERAVVVVFQTPAGRTGRGVISYEEGM